MFTFYAMRKEILEMLQTRFEGVSASILGRIADRLAKTATNTAEARAAVDAVTIQQLLESYGDSRATEAVTTAVRNYEAKYGLREGLPAPKDTDPKPDLHPKADTVPTDAPPAWAKALIEANKSLSDKLAAMEARRVSDTRRSSLAQAYSRLPEPLRKGYERISVDALSDEDFNALRDTIGKEVDDIMAQQSQRGAVFGRPGNNVAPDTTRLTPDQEAAIAHREGSAAKDGQPF